MSRLSSKSSPGHPVESDIGTDVVVAVTWWRSANVDSPTSRSDNKNMFLSLKVNNDVSSCPFVAGRYMHDNARPIDNTQVSKLGDIQANPRTAMCLPSQSVYLQELILNYSFI